MRFLLTKMKRTFFTNKLFLILLLSLLIVASVIICTNLYRKEDYPVLNYLPEPYIPLNYSTYIPYVKESVPNLYFSNNNTLMLLRAVTDIRFNCIRIMCALLRNYDKKLEVKVDNNVVDYKIKYYGSMIFQQRDFPLKYANIMIAIYPNITSIKVNEIEIPYTPINEIKHKYNFTVCITALHSKFNATTILNQTINIYKKLGASHILIYFGDISREAYDIIKYYESTGFVEIYYWPKLIMLQYILYFGQIIKMNDCFYRSYYNSKYVINSDIDEIMIPIKYNTLSDLISFYEYNHRKCKLFYFLNKIFPKQIGYIDVISKNDRKGFFIESTMSDCDLFNLALSCKASGESRKYIVSTELVEALRIHGVEGGADNCCYISDKDGFFHHTRYIPIRMMKECKKLSHDYTILKYK